MGQGGYIFIKVQQSLVEAIKKNNIKIENNIDVFEIHAFKIQAK